MRQGGDLARSNVRARVGAAAVAILVCCGGCTSSSKSQSSPSPTPAAPTATTQGTAEFCSNYAALKASLSQLTSLNVIAVGTSGLSAAADDVKAKATALAASAGVFAPQVNALTTAIDQLQPTVSGLSSSGLRGALPTITAQIAAVARAGQELAAAVKTACPSSSGS
jgi:hypothetical protein